MVFRVDGTEQFGALTAYRLRNDETGDTVLSWDPSEVAMATGEPAPAPGSPIPSPPVPTPGQSPPRPAPGGPTPAPAPGTTPAPGAPPPTAGFLGDPGRFGLAGGTRDRRTAMATGPAAGDVGTGTTTETRAPERADVSAPEPGTEDDDGLVDMSGEAEQAGGGGAGAAQPTRPQYASETPFDIGLPMPVMPRGSPRVAAGFRPTTKKQKGDPETVTDLRQDYARLLDEQMRVADSRAKLQYEEGFRAREQGELYRQRNLEEQRKERAKLAELQDWQTKRLAELDSDSKALAEKQVDENRWYKSAGAGGVFLAALFQGMGAAGASLTGSPNYAMEIFDNFIKADIANQKEEWRSASDKLTVKQNAYARELQNGMSPQLAEKKIELLQNQFAESQLQDEATVKALNAIGVDTAALKAEYREKNLKLRTDFESILGQELEERYRNASGGGGPSLDQQIKFFQAMEARAKAGRASGEAAGIFPSEAIQLEREKQGAKSMRPGTESFDEAIRKYGADVNGGPTGSSIQETWMYGEILKDTVKSVMEKHGELPGRGVVEDLMPEWLTLNWSDLNGADKRKVARAARAFSKANMHRTTGAAFGEREEKVGLELDAALGNENALSETEILQTMTEALRRTNSLKAAREAAHPPEVVEEFDRRLMGKLRSARPDLTPDEDGFESVD